MSVTEGITVSEYQRAEAQLWAKEGRVSFYVHAAVYALVNALLIIINLVVVPGFLWFLFPLIGWGIGLTMHYLFAVRFEQGRTKDWQVRVEQRARENRMQAASTA